MTEVIPAILEKDFAEIEKKIHLVESLVNWVQIDFADNTLVPNTTFLDATFFGTLKTNVRLEAHLMVSDPLKYLENFAKVGFKRFFAHVEGSNIEEFLTKGEELDIEVGLAIDGPTALEKLLPFMEDLDCVLVMGIEAGFSGKPFREDTVEKIKKIREIDFEIPIAVDGNMNLKNAQKVVAAGATRINSNSYIFGAKNIEEVIKRLAAL